MLDNIYINTLCIYIRIIKIHHLTRTIYKTFMEIMLAALWVYGPNSRQNGINKLTHEEYLDAKATNTIPTTM